MGLPAALRARGGRVTAIDTKVGGAAHDLRDVRLQRQLVAQVAAGHFDTVFIATPCQSFSVAHKPQLRTRRSPTGMAHVPPEWSAYLDKHNKLADFSAALALTAHAAGIPWAIENPADRGDPTSEAHWPQMANHAPLWVQPEIVQLRADTHAATVTFPQCFFEAEWQKYTTIMHSAAMSTHLGAMRGATCDHRRHTPAYGRDARGAARAERAAAYPAALNEAIASALCATAWQQRDASASGDASTGDKGGLVVNGAQLGEHQRAACEAARRAPPSFASLRNRIEASREELLATPMPAQMHRPTAPPTAKKPSKPKGRPLPKPTEGGEEACDAAILQPEGKITVWMLYGDGVYQNEILAWMAKAKAAALAILKGETPPKVPTLRIPQSRMPAWARGRVWDCRDPYDCVEVARSTRDTAFPGARQLDRAKLREVAEEMRWHDRDLLLQLGEGGAESRSAVALETVLSFHHQGLAAHYAAAKGVIDAAQAEEWVSGLYTHIPMAPTRLIPRNVVMQDRMRVRDDGSLESYLKPRVTANGSEGETDSFNANIPTREVAVQLPTAQRFGRGLAVIDSIIQSGSSGAHGGDDPGETGGSDGAPCSAGAYAIDLEAAYNFVVVQRAEWWLQVFCWWEETVEADGSVGVRIGFCIEYRLVFGGAYAPNRFERLTTLVGAWIQRQQAAFDASRPYPPRIQAALAVRAAAQRRGELPEGEEQVSLRYLQVYLDDYNGGTSTDVVTVPADLASVPLPTAPTIQGGGVPAAPNTRVYVHAQIAIRAVRTIGFADSANKTCVGTPIASLGLLIDIGGKRIRCPAKKRSEMLFDLQAQTCLAEQQLLVDTKLARRMVGRLVNLSQIFPELKLYLHGGYRVTARPEQQAQVRMRKDRAAYVGWTNLLEEARRLLDSNDGVPLAPRALPPPRDAEGVWTSTTDASGVDGLGGYVFIAERPREVWLVSERWPDTILAALHAAASEGSARADAKQRMLPMLSMPAAELVTAWLVPSAVADATGTKPYALYAVGDCAPATCALNSATGGNPQMRRALQGARSLCEQWIAAHVKREYNTDADRLSHPAQAATVAKQAAEAGFFVHEARIPKPLWAEVTAAALIGAGGGPAMGFEAPGKRRAGKRKRGRGYALRAVRDRCTHTHTAHPRAHVYAHAPTAHAYGPRMSSADVRDNARWRLLRVARLWAPA